MKAIRFHKYGDPGVLKLEEVAMPDVPAGYMLIRVEAAGVNHGDVMRRQNSYPGVTPLPFTPGSGVAGLVEVVGEGITEFQTGARVFALTAWGGYAEFVAAPVAQVFSLPTAIGAAEATALLVQGLTAWIAIRHAGRGGAGQSILIQAASSGVGTIAVQLARAGGAKRVFALASTSEKCALAVSLGADAAFDYADPNWPEKLISENHGEGVDLVLDMIGSPIFEQSLSCLASFGRSVVLGFPNGKLPTLSPAQLMIKSQEVIGFYLPTYLSRPEIVQEGIDDLLALTLQGKLRPVMGTAFPLEEAAEAHRMLEARHSTGKIVLLP